MTQLGPSETPFGVAYTTAFTNFANLKKYYTDDPRPLALLSQPIFTRSNPRGFGRERDIGRFLDEIQDHCPDGDNHNSGNTGDNEAAHCGPPARIIV